MFGLEILDVVIGLVFVYLLLSLFATALNEYVSAVFNLRGKELARGLFRLLDDVDEKDATGQALAGLRARVVTESATLTQRLYNHPLIRPLATRRGVLFSFRDTPRLPSYIPARTFSMALLDLLKVRDREASRVDDKAGHETEGGKDAQLMSVLGILKRDSPLDVNQHLGQLKDLLGAADLPPDVKLRTLGTLAETQTQLHALQDSVEVWFNNAMDRVSGAYKRVTQGVLFVLGLAIAGSLNADTIQMWRQLSENDALRTAMAERAAGTLARLDTVVHRTREDSPAAGAARERYLDARAELDSLEMKFGWSGANAWPRGLGPSLLKVIGLLMTAVAISLGAPFWFDLLNKVISIRAAGRSPEERPKSPEGGPKRPAERAPK